MKKKLHNGFWVPESCSSEELKLYKKNPHPRDYYIIFDEIPHRYYIKGVTEGWTSVTTVVHECFSEFNAYMIAKNMVKSKNFPGDPKYEKYRQITEIPGLSQAELIQKIMKSWEDNCAEAADLGTQLHRSIELFYNDVLEEKENDSVEYQNHFGDFKVVAKELLNLEPYRTEWTVYSEEDKICGSVDMLFRNTKTGKFALMDWKRSREIKLKGFKKGKFPCDDISDCNMEHYTLQLNFYKYIMETYYGLEIETMDIVVFHPNNPTFKSFTVPNRQDKIKQILKFRKEQKEIYQEEEDMTDIMSMFQ